MAEHCHLPPLGPRGSQPFSEPASSSIDQRPDHNPAQIEGQNGLVVLAVPRNVQEGPVVFSKHHRPPLQKTGFPVPERKDLSCPEAQDHCSFAKFPPDLSVRPSCLHGSLCGEHSSR